MFSIWNCVSCSNLSESKKELFCKACQRELRNALNARDSNDTNILNLRVRSIGKYEGIWAKWIKDLKRRSRGFILSEEREFLELMVEYYFCYEDFSHIDAIVPVPSHPGRLIFESDLGALLAVTLSKQIKKPMLPLLGMSLRWMMLGKASQKDRSKVNDRWKILREEKFTAKNTPLPLNVLLVDDVFTTGATLLSAKRCLEKSGITCREAVVLASYSHNNSVFTDTYTAPHSDLPSNH